MRCRRPGEREQAVRLLCSLGGAEYVPLLTRLASDTEESILFREMVLPYLLALGGELPEETFVDEEVDRWFHCQHHSDDAGKLLLLFRNSITLDRFQQFVEHYRAGRAEVLAQLAGEPLTPPEWREWLYKSWLEMDRFQCQGHTVWTDAGNVAINARIAYLFRDRPEAAEILREYRIESPEKAFEPSHSYYPNRLWDAEWDTLASGLWRDEAELLEAVTSAPADFRRQAEKLSLPQKALEVFWSPQEVLARIERAFRTFVLDEHGCFPAQSRYVLQLAQRWRGEEMDECLTNLYLCPDLPSKVRSELYDVIWERGWRWDSEATRAAVRDWAEANCASWRKGEALLRLAEAPRPEDRDFFLWAAGVEQKPEFRYLAVRSLSRLGERAPEWREKLESLRKDPDRQVRIAAAAALLRLGDERQRRVLVEAARSAKDPLIQREALESLGDIEGERHVALFGEVLAAAPTRKWSDDRVGLYSHATLEAVLQLAKIGTREALTELLRGCLRGAETRAIGDRCEYFAAAVRRWEGESVELPERPYWRWERPWEWRCA